MWEWLKWFDHRGTIIHHPNPSLRRSFCLALYKAKSTGICHPPSTCSLSIPMLQVPANTRMAGWIQTFWHSSSPGWDRCPQGSSQAGRQLSAGLGLCWAAYAGLEFESVPKRSVDQRDDIWHQESNPGVWLVFSLKSLVLFLQVAATI